MGELWPGESTKDGGGTRGGGRVTSDDVDTVLPAGRCLMLSRPESERSARCWPGLQLTIDRPLL